ncbi:hypothetical protein CVT26_008313 [Gymnopilus dilepis]|uniref:Uncharacterized protein n=1 Tax=Gymnopilus dilepis TaxID=231916 RepID=A0A409X8Q8_9AGAR|nr:hypothetical protein CVT26_008313 [Gymnopilus dilepis]
MSKAVHDAEPTGRRSVPVISTSRKPGYDIVVMKASQLERWASTVATGAEGTANNRVAFDLGTCECSTFVPLFFNAPVNIQTSLSANLGVHIE